jgi:hypothetical protein
MLDRLQCSQYLGFQFLLEHQCHCFIMCCALRVDKLQQLNSQHIITQCAKYQQHRTAIALTDVRHTRAIKTESKSLNYTNTKRSERESMVARCGEWVHCTQVGIAQHVAYLLLYPFTQDHNYTNSNLVCVICLYGCWYFEALDELFQQRKWVGKRLVRQQECLFICGICIIHCQSSSAWEIQ